MMSKICEAMFSGLSGRIYDMFEAFYIFVFTFESIDVLHLQNILVDLWFRGEIMKTTKFPRLKLNKPVIRKSTNLPGALGD